MKTDFNETYLTFGGHIELHRYRYLYFVFLLKVYVLIVFGNFTIVFLVVTRPSLHEPMYIFIAALSLNSVLFSTVIYPKLLVDFLSARQVISPLQCSVQRFLYYSLGSSEFLLLAVMAFDRHVSIGKPLHYAAVMRNRLIYGLLAFAWLFPAALLAPSISVSHSLKLCRFSVPGMFCNNVIFKLCCVVPQWLTTYGLFIVMNTVVVPFVYIIFTYSKVLLISHRSCREVRTKAAQTCIPHLLVLVSFSCLCTYDITAVRLAYSMPKTVHLIMTLQIILYHPLFNPMIYGLKMKEIWKQVKRLFCPGNGR